MDSSHTFKENLETGKTGESFLANWFKYKGYNILPVYEQINPKFKGPTVYMADGSEIVSPDMIIFKKDKIFWIEVKCKSAFTEYHITGKFQTGIDIKHFRDYQKIMKNFSGEVWLLFLQGKGIAKDSNQGPSGLYGNTLKYLTEHVDHESENYGPSGMVYWNLEDLKFMDSYENVKLVQECYS